MVRGLLSLLLLLVSWLLLAAAAAGSCGTTTIWVDNEFGMPVYDMSDLEQSLCEWVTHQLGGALQIRSRAVSMRRDKCLVGGEGCGRCLW